MLLLLSAFSGQISPREKGAEQAIQPLLKHQPIKCRTLNQGQTTTAGISSPTLFDKCVDSLTDN